MSIKKIPRVVITGLGAVSPIGNTAQETWQAMMDCKSGSAPITRFDTTHFDTKFACEVKGFDASQFINRKEIQRLDLFSQYALATAEMAIKDAELNFENCNKERVGVVFGSGIGGMTTFEIQTKEFLQRGKPDRISPFFVPMMISDIAAGHISIRWGLKGPNYGIVSACATSSNAIADAFMLIQRGMADIVLSGGSEAAVTVMGIGGFNALKALSTRNDSPETASRPFDATRDGFVLGEGGGVVILETLEHALNRGAKIYAEMVGIGLTDDGFHITQPAPGGEGAVRSMRLAIEDAGLLPTDIDYINAHGTSTPFNDRNETAAIKTLFGEHAYKLVVSSTKSMTGHLLGAAGAIETIATVLAISNNIAPPTINYSNPDPDCDLNYAPNKPVELNIKAAISNTFGFGGHNASLCFKKFEE